MFLRRILRPQIARWRFGFVSDRSVVFLAGAITLDTVIVATAGILDARKSQPVPTQRAGIESFAGVASADTRFISLQS